MNLEKTEYLQISSTKPEEAPSLIKNLAFEGLLTFFGFPLIKNIRKTHKI